MGTKILYTQDSKAHFHYEKIRYYRKTNQTPSVGLAQSCPVSWFPFQLYSVSVIKTMISWVFMTDNTRFPEKLLAESPMWFQIEEIFESKRSAPHSPNFAEMWNTVRCTSGKVDAALKTFFHSLFLKKILMRWIWLACDGLWWARSRRASMLIVRRKLFTERIWLSVAAASSAARYGVMGC